MTALELADLLAAIREARRHLMFNVSPEAQAIYLRLADASQPLVLALERARITITTTQLEPPHGE